MNPFRRPGVFLVYFHLGLVGLPILFLCAPDGLTAGRGAPGQTPPRAEFSGLPALVTALAFSPDGKQLAAGTGDGGIHLWDVSAQKAAGVIKAHGGPVTTLAYAGDGKMLASGGADKVIRLWDTPKGQARSNLAGHADRISALAFAPNGTLASASHDKTVRLWDIAAGKEIGKFADHKDKVTALALSPNGKQIASGGADNVVMVRDSATGKLVGSVTSSTDENAKEVTGLAFTNDGTKLVTANVGIKGAVWEVDAMNRLDSLSTRSSHTGRPGLIAVSPDGSVWVGANNETAFVGSMKTGKQLGSFETGHTALSAMALSPDGRTLATGGGDKTIRLWSLIWSKELATVEHPIKSLSVDVAGKTVAALDDHQLTLWDLKLGKTLGGLRPVKGLFVSFSPGASQWAALWKSDVDKPKVEVTDAQGNKRHRSVLSLGEILKKRKGDDGPRLRPGHAEIIDLDGKGEATGWHFVKNPPSGCVMPVAISPNGQRRAAAYAVTKNENEEKAVVEISNTATGKSATLPKFEDVHGLTWAPDNRTLAIVELNGTIHLWDVSAGRRKALVAAQIRAYSDGSSSETMPLAFSPDSKLLATTKRANVVDLWDTATGKTAGSIVTSQSVRSLAFVGDAKTLAVGGQETVGLWDVASGQLRQILVPPGDEATPIVALAATPDGKTLLAARKNGKTMHAWDISPERLTPFKAGPSTLVTSTARFTFRQHILNDGGSHFHELVFAPDGNYIASAGPGAVRIWQPLTGSERLVLTSEKIGFTASHVAFSRDGKLLATGDDSYHAHPVKVWSILEKKEAVKLKWTKQQLSCLTFGRDGKTLLTGAINGHAVQVWDLATGNETASFKGDWGQVLAFHPDGKTLLGWKDQKLALWDMTTGKMTASLEGTSKRQGYVYQARAVAFSPDGKQLATSHLDRDIHLFSTATGKQLAAFKGHADECWSLAFTPDGKHLAAAGLDRTVRIWNVATAQEVAVIREHTGRVCCIAVTPDGKMLASAANDGLIKVIDLAKLLAGK